MVPLFQSKVFYYQFDYDNWIAIHTNSDEISKGYNKSVFLMREKDTYDNVFPGIEDISEDIQKGKVESKDINKIKYTINMLTACF